ncbi:tRNA pseudouridine(38-40) synthase TruA [Halanaerocella petrolearia]
MRNLKCTVAYDGTNYHGFQRQPKQSHVATVQGKIEDAISKLIKQEIDIVGASRTDADVHAKGQVFNCQIDSSIPTEKFALALNTKLPDDIVILKTIEVDSEFHARYHNQGKRYFYQIYHDYFMSPFWRNHAYHVYRPLDLEAMKEAAQYLIGKHDFSSFRAKGCNAKTPIRTILELSIEKEDELITINVHGDGFLYKMVRTMVGTLIQVGLGKLKPEQMEDILAAKDREVAGPNAPGYGLFLEEIYY